MKSTGALLLVLLLAFVFFKWNSLFPREPAYEGKRLTVWIEQWNSNGLKSRFDPGAKKAAEEAHAAINHIGPQGIPFLLKLMGDEESGMKRKLRSVVPRQWHRPLRIEYPVPVHKTIGALGIRAMGTNAAPAVPGLMELLSAEIARAPGDPYKSYMPLNALDGLGDAAAPAIPIMIQALKHKDAGLSYQAAWTLARLRIKPEIVIPALVRFLESHEAVSPNTTKSAAIQAIGAYGTNGALAAPAITSLLTHSDAEVREAATNCLRAIDREAARQIYIHSQKR